MKFHIYMKKRPAKTGRFWIYTESELIEVQADLL